MNLFTRTHCADATFIDFGRVATVRSANVSHWIRSTCSLQPSRPTKKLKHYSGHVAKVEVPLELQRINNSHCTFRRLLELLVQVQITASKHSKHWLLGWYWFIDGNAGFLSIYNSVCKYPQGFSSLQRVSLKDNVQNISNYIRKTHIYTVYIYSIYAHYIWEQGPHGPMLRLRLLHGGRANWVGPRALSVGVQPWLKLWPRHR